MQSLFFILDKKLATKDQRKTFQNLVHPPGLEPGTSRTAFQNKVHPPGLEPGTSRV